MRLSTKNYRLKFETLILLNQTISLSDRQSQAPLESYDKRVNNGNPGSSVNDSIPLMSAYSEIYVKNYLMPPTGTH